jgi:SAM-dependent methyltransferase
LLSIKAEQIVADAEFDFAFSMNVMEHVDDVPLVLGRVVRALRPGAAYRFVCPNYGFPYEPHFDMPTLLSKSLTWRFLRNRILNSRTVLDPRGTWQSLNWISVAAVRRTCRRDLGIEPEFDRTVLYCVGRLTIPVFSGAIRGFSVPCAPPSTQSASQSCSA